MAHLVLDALRAWADVRRLGLHLDVESSTVVARRCYEAYGFRGTGATEPLREGSDEVTERMLLT